MTSSMRAWTFLGLFSIAILFLGYSVGGREGLMWSLLISLSINSLVYFYSDQHLASLFGGREIEGQDPWSLNPIVAKVAAKARLPMPRVLVLQRQEPQAMCFGRSWKSGTVVMTEGLLNSLSKQELEAVVAYLVACIQRMDTLSFSVGGSFCGAILFCTDILDMIGRWIIGGKRDGVQSHLFSFVSAPIVGMLLRFCVGRRNYFHIDAEAAKYIENPKILAEVLWKLQSYASTQPLAVPPATSQFFIVNPLTGRGWNRYFRIQPPVEKRIKKLIGYFPI